MRNTVSRFYKALAFVFAMAFIVLSAVLVLGACKLPAGDETPPEPKPWDSIPDRPMDTDLTNIIADFRTGTNLPGNFGTANNYTNGGMFATTYWYSESVTVGGGKLDINFDYNSKIPSTYSSGEVRSHAKYSYGYYSVKMKPMKKSGIISSFFTYTNRPWDEIDIEFVGRDTTTVQFNYFKNGVGGNEYYHDLGFDAADDFHVYGFDWREDKIIWFVDGKAVYMAEGDMPAASQQIMMNLWQPVGMGDGWAGAFDPASGLPGAASYQWVAYTAD